MNVMELGMSWLALREKGRPIPGDFVVSEAPSGAGGFEMMLSVDSDNFRHLLIATDQQDDQPTFGTAGVRILSRTLEDRGRVRTFVDVICLRPDLNDLFDVLVVEIANSLKKSSNDPASVCRRILERWQDLLARDRPPTLGIDSLTGLFGELHYLLGLLRVNPRAIRCWFGPQKQRHDFSVAGLAVEVKSSRSRYGRKCEIHGHDQLQAPADTNLYLAYIRLETPAPDGLAVPDLVDSVLDLAIDRAATVQKLRDLGYDLRQRDEYREWRFRVTEQRLYAVDEHFPKITNSSFLKGSLPDGVTGLVYDIDLSGEVPCPLPDQAADAVLRKMAEGADHV